MARLTEAMKRYIVQRLACYDRPMTIVAGVKEEFGVEVPRQQVHFYDPDHGRPAKPLRALFAATREAFSKELAKEPAMLRAVRVRRLARMADRAEERRNDLLAASFYEQIAKEDGGMFTNRRVLVPSDPLAELAKTMGYSVDQLTELLGADEAQPVAAP